MAVLYRAIAICVLLTALGQWYSFAALNEGSASAVGPSPSVKPSGTTIKSIAASMTVMPYRNMTVTPSRNMTVVPSHNMTVMPSRNMTVTPSHNMTVTPHNMTVTPHNMTVMPSRNMTVTPSHNMTVTPSHNITVMPHNKTVMPSHNRTIMPSSAHTVMPTSSVHPTSPPPKPGNFSVTDANGTVCLIAHMAAKFDIMIDSKRIPSVVMPDNATANGICDTNSTKPYIVLKWQTKQASYNFTMHFIINESGDLKASSPHWAAANLTFSMKTEVGVSAPAYTFHSGVEPQMQLSAKVGHAYECMTSNTDFMLAMATNSTVNVSLSYIEFQPFKVHNGKPGEAENCSPAPAPPVTGSTVIPTTKGKESHVVPIAVGCTLAGLVVIVVIGYLIGRRHRRNASAGYSKL